MKKLWLLPLTALLLCTSACFKDNDDTESAINADSSINDFVYRALNYFYLYKADTPELANDAFSNDSEKNAFVRGFESPESLFEFLKSDQDRFSLLFPDYIAIENSLSGISLNNGMEFGLVRYPQNDGRVFGYIRYVLPNTSAANQGLQRGIVFNTIDGTQITESNFNSLLAPDSYTIGIATYDGVTVTPTNNSVTLVKEQVTENPIHIAKTIDVNGQRIGYLMYNGFTSDFDEELNTAFGEFQANNIDELVLDLRYNGGGSVRTATDLASMITGQFFQEIFYTEQWNEDRQNLAQPGLFNNTTRNGTPLNSLNLTQVYVLTSERTASASELIINGLAPYINVVQIGDTTTGKFQASTLLYDAPAPNFNRSQANPTHRYVMLPLIFKTVNATGNTDFINGLTPDIEQFEDFSNLGILGEIDEPLLATALGEIVTLRQVKQPKVKLKTISESKALSPTYQIMIKE